MTQVNDLEALQINPSVVTSPSESTTEHAALLAFGANLGEPKQAWREALERLAQHGVRITGTSRLWETAPVGGPEGQGTFLNAAMTVTTAWTAAELVRELLAVEREVGRVRETRWGPRLMDLDLLLFDDLVSSDPDCVVPHPRMTFRRFMLDPACEVAADWRHPLTGSSLGTLQTELHQKVRRVRVLGVPSEGVSAGASEPGSPGAPSGPWGPEHDQALRAVKDCLRQSHWDATGADTLSTAPVRLTVLLTSGIHPSLGQVGGPYLCLPWAEPGSWVTEIRAALQAMD